MNGRDAFKLLVMAAALVCVAMLIGQVSAAHEAEETEIVRDAVRNAALTCYAVEGAYPESVDYLREHYRLAYDEERYLVSYDAFASNMLPDIWVTETGADGP